MVCKCSILYFIVAIGITAALHLNDYRIKSKFTPRIYDGNKVAINKFPYFVSLRTSEEKPDGFNITEHFCGGAIIGSRWILTAAHCRVNCQRSNAVIVVGANNSRENGVIHNIQEIILHDSLKMESELLKSDIALLKTQRTIEFNENVQAIALDEEWIGGGLDATVCGFGFEKVCFFL